METLNDIGLGHATDKSTLLHGYLDFYQENLPGRDFSGRLLEIGVYHGASLKMWREYYPNAEIVGIDIKPKVSKIDGVNVVVMDCKDITTLRTLGDFDIIIDDGSHTMIDQQVSFWWLYNHQLNGNGFYVMEDLHTSFMPKYINAPTTTYDLLKELYEVKEYNENNGGSITFILRKDAND